MSYAVRPSIWSSMYLECPYLVDQIVKGFLNHPCSWLGLLMGGVSVCHMVWTEEEASSCSCLHMQALAACVSVRGICFFLCSPLQKYPRSNLGVTSEIVQLLTGFPTFTFPDTSSWVSCSFPDTGTVLAHCTSGPWHSSCCKDWIWENFGFLASWLYSSKTTSQ